MLLKQVVEVVGLSSLTERFNCRTRVCSYCGYCGYCGFRESAKPLKPQKPQVVFLTYIIYRALYLKISR